MTQRRERVAPLRVEFRHSPLSPRSWAALALLLLLGAAGLTAVEALVPSRLSASERNRLLHYYEVRNGRIETLDPRLGSFLRAMAPETRAADVLLLGPSAAREALVAEEELTAGIVAAGGTELTFRKLTSSGQKLMEALFILDRADLRPGQVVVLVASPTSVLIDRIDGSELTNGDYLENPIPFFRRYVGVLPELARELEPMDQIVTDWQVARRRLYREIHAVLTNRLLSEFYGATLPPPREYMYDHLDAPNPGLRAWNLAYLRRRLGGVDRDAAANGARLIQVIAAHLAEKGVSLMLVDSPMVVGEETTVFDQSVWKAYSQLLAKVRGMGLPVIDVNPDAGLREEDFVDGRHTTAAGRVRWSTALAQRLATSLRTPVALSGGR